MLNKSNPKKYNPRYCKEILLGIKDNIYFPKNFFIIPNLKPSLKGLNSMLLEANISFDLELKMNA